jgi:glycosyltransferase involved in cell wall biosynthesis
MKLGVVSGPRYSRVGDQYYTSTSFHAEMWKECLEVFDEVVIADRVVYAQKIGPGERPVLSDGISIFEFPNYEGIWGIVKVAFRFFLRSRKGVRQADVWSLHGPSFESFCVWFWLWFYGIPYCQEMRGEQSLDIEYLKQRGTRCAKLVELCSRLILRLQLSHALSVVAVSQYLIDEYSARYNRPKYAISDNRVPADLYMPTRSWSEDQKVLTIVSVGRLDAQKNPLGTMRALAKLNQKGFTNWKFIWIGDGTLEAETRQFSEELGLSDKVSFCGFVPWGPELFAKLRSADLLVVNSIDEGGPRTVYEAMAVSLPVIGTPVGNIPAVLAEEDMFPKMRDDLLADKLYQVLTNPARLTKMAQRNEQVAKEYSAEVLSAKKIEFYKDLKIIAEEFLKRTR